MLTGQPLRVAVVNFSRRRVGGVESYLDRVIPAFRAAGLDLFFFSERDSPPERSPIAATGDIASASVDVVGPEEALNALRAWGPDLAFVHGLHEPDLERQVLDIAPAVLFAHGYYGTCISGTKTTRFPVRRPCERVFGPACLAHYLPRRCGGLSPITMVREYGRQTARRESLRRYRNVVVFSDHIRREMEAHGVAPERLRKVPACAGGCADDDVAPSTSGASDAVRLSFIGRLDAIKGCDLLIRALPLVHAALRRPIVLNVAGDGPDVARCRHLAAGIAASDAAHVRFHGWIADDARQRLLSETDLLVMPSLLPEPYGLAGAEALAHGVPVTAFASGGVREWLDDGVNGTLAPADPPTARGLADAIARCIQAPSIADRVRHDAAALRGRLSIEAHVAAVIPILRQAFEQTSPAAAVH